MESDNKSTDSKGLMRMKRYYRKIACFTLQRECKILNYVYLKCNPTIAQNDCRYKSKIKILDFDFKNEEMQKKLKDIEFSKSIKNEFRDLKKYLLSLIYEIDRIIPI